MYHRRERSVSMSIPLSTLLRATAFNLAFYLWTFALAVGGLPFLSRWQPEQVRAYARFWLRGVHRLLRASVGLDYEVRGLERLPPGPLLIAAKHQSAWETLTFHLLLPDIVVGLKEELVRIPLFGRYLRAAGSIVIDRGNPQRAIRSLVEGAKRAVARGESVLVFPEGTRRPPGAPPDYKPGVAALYRALGVPCVPVALNSGLFWGRRSWLKFPGRITVSFLEPIAPGLDRASFMRLLEERIERETAALVRAAAPPTGARDRLLPRATREASKGFVGASDCSMIRPRSESFEERRR